jgi:7-keto-8-aminopelargonate synthetase-like enzyme
VKRGVVCVSGSLQEGGGDHLEQLLQRSPEGARKLVMTDSLFSMDGDYADVEGA